ncbi:hypothetical protein BJX61DRAFT_259072 [Aspergillus egyptiacus]|nr:hypothetical protein BJX61DRAFT_259072 [Aspergillus egyptiacus]
MIPCMARNMCNIYSSIRGAPMCLFTSSSQPPLPPSSRNRSSKRPYTYICPSPTTLKQRPHRGGRQDKMSQVQQYWLPGYGLSRQIVIGQIQYFLGPSATARPYTYQGREGYLIVGVPLTREQINDLAVMSREYERQETLRMAGDSNPDSEPYINEIIPVRLPSGPTRRRPGEFEPRRGRC